MRNLQFITDVPGIINGIAAATTGTLTVFSYPEAHGDSCHIIARFLEK